MTYSKELWTVNSCCCGKESALVHGAYTLPIQPLLNSQVVQAIDIRQNDSKGILKKDVDC